MHPVSPLFILLDSVVGLYSLTVLVRVIADWMMVFRSAWRFGSVVQFLRQVTEPVLRPLRRVLDPYQRRSGFDFSPLVLILLLGVLRQVLRRLATGW